MAQTSQTHGGPHSTQATDRPSARIWSVYLSHTDTLDRAMAENWKGNMDALLIFAGLFSASITAFLVESYKTLAPDPTIALLSHISLQLATLANGTQPNIAPPVQPVFKPTSASLLCNALWFLSLAFSLACALAATLVDQWARSYLNQSQLHPAPHKRARIRAYLSDGLIRFRMIAVVEAIPTLLHISLFLFFAGLIEFLLPINVVIGKLSMVILGFCSALYLVITLLPILYNDSPYRTPMSAFCWWTLQSFSRFVYSGSQPTTISQAQELAATTERDTRDEIALRRTLRYLTEDTEMQPFVEGIPGFLSEGGVNVTIMRQLLADTDIRLGTRIVLHLRRSGYQDAPEKARTAVACLRALWSLVFNCCEHQSPQSIKDWFDDETLPVFETFKYSNPSLTAYLTSTTALFTMHILDSFLSSATAIENQLSELGVGSPWSNSAEPWIEQSRVQRYFTGSSPEVGSGCIMALKAWLARIRRSFAVTKTENDSRRPSPPYIPDDLMQSLFSFQAVVDEARVTVFNDFVDALLSDSPPDEAWETFYSIVIDADLSVFPVGRFLTSVHGTAEACGGPSPRHGHDPGQRKARRRSQEHHHQLSTHVPG